ncbi:hypothetical protein Tco_1095254 [Tanacetum coccineum]
MSFNISVREGSSDVGLLQPNPLDSLKGIVERSCLLGRRFCLSCFLSMEYIGISVSEGISRNYTILDEDTYPRFCVLKMAKGGLLNKMDLLSFIKNRRALHGRGLVERPKSMLKMKHRLLDNTVGRVLFYCYPCPDRAGVLKASWIQVLTSFLMKVVAVTKRSRTQLLYNQCVKEKEKTIVSDAGGPSHPSKKLREDHGTPGGPTVGGKSRSAVQRFLVGAVQNVGVRGEAIPTLPFVTSSVSATPEREDGDHTESLAGTNLRTIGAPQRFVISSDSSLHSGANIAEAEVDSFARPSVLLMTVTTTVTSTVDPTTTVKENFVGSFVFGGGSSSGADHTVGGFSDLTGSDFIVGDDGHSCRKMMDGFAPPKFFASVRGMEHDQLFMKFNVGAACQMSLSAEVRMRAEYNIREKRRLNVVVEEKNSLLKARDEEIESLKAQLLVKEAEAAEAICLCAEASRFEVVEKSLCDEVKVLKEQNTALEQERTNLSVKVADIAASVKSDNLADRVHELETSSVGLQEKVTAYENFIDQLKKFQDEKMKEVNKKFDKLCTDFVEMALHLEEKFYPHLLTTIFGRQWLLTHGMELAIAKCLNSTEYLSTLRAAIGKAVKKGMREGISAGITHGAEGRKLTDVAAYNPSAEADYLSALQRLQSVNYSLITELRANKDASIDTIMNLLRLEDTLAERLALRGVFVPLSKPLSALALEGMEGTSGGAPSTADTTTTLSIVVASTSIVRPISIDDYEVTGADDQATVDGNVADKDANAFSNVDDTELNVSE